MKLSYAISREAWQAETRTLANGAAFVPYTLSQAMARDFWEAAERTLTTGIDAGLRGRSRLRQRGRRAA